MALIKCEECGKEISNKAKICMNCGAKTEKAKKENIKICIILSIIVTLIVLSIISIFIFQKINDKTELSAKEVVDYLKKEGYNFKANKYISYYTTYYIYVSNEKVAFQRIDSTLLGTMYSWNDNNVNAEWANIYKNDNDTIAEKMQYEAYQKWLKNLGLKEEQIIEALDYLKNNTTVYETI